MDRGDLVLLGITQEQHPERCRLFAQWQQFEWPILHDPINVIGSRAVPITIAIDEHGIVRSTRPQSNRFEEQFLNKNFPAPAETSAQPEPSPPSIDKLLASAKKNTSAAGWKRVGDAAVLWGGESNLNLAIKSYSAALKLEPKDPASHFRLGVALRMRYESKHRKAADFKQAINSWGRALDLDPNQYIYRRRIQQYGPRLAKPYSFYDWVAQAKQEITARGETPIALPVEPSGAELARPQRKFSSADETGKSPDPQGRIARDKDRLIQVAAVTVPARIRAGQAARIHLELRPSANAHWNNEAEPLQVWVDAPQGWEVARNLLSAAQPDKPESRETRAIEFEIKSPTDAKSNGQVSGYALYYVCEDAGGRCFYLRQDFEVTVPITSGNSN